MSTESRSHNLEAIAGTDDMDLVKTWNLDPSVAYTPDINMAMADAIKQNNYDLEYKDAIDRGMSQDDAIKRANKIATDGYRLAKKNIAYVTKMRAKK